MPSYLYLVEGSGAPGVTLDSSKSIRPGTFYRDAATDNLYVCANPAVGAAVWVPTGLSGVTAAELGFLDGATAGTAVASKALVAGANKEIGGLGNVTLDDAKNVAVGTTTGTKIGTAATQKLGFWNVTPVVQPAGAAQAALTNSTGGTADGTLEAVGATNGGDESGAINNNFTELHTLLNAIRTALVGAGIIKGAA